MSGILQLDYYYGIEAEQFSFYRVLVLCQDLVQVKMRIFSPF